MFRGAEEVAVCAELQRVARGMAMAGRRRWNSRWPIHNLCPIPSRWIGLRGLQNHGGHPGSASSPLLQSSLLYHNKKERREKPRLREALQCQGADRADICTGAGTTVYHESDLPTQLHLQLIVWRKVWTMCGGSHTSTPLSSITLSHTSPPPPPPTPHLSLTLHVHASP